MKDDENNIIIPSTYSRHVYIGAPFLAYLGWIAHTKKFPLVKYITPPLLVCSLIHWNKPKSNSMIRKIDWLLAISMIIAISSYEKRFRKHDVFLWRLSVFIQLFTVIINGSIFDIETNPCSLLHVFFPMFKYTFPNTKDRENAYKRCVYTHILFVHFLPGYVAARAMLKSVRN